jgi:hypothetical protein
MKFYVLLTQKRKNPGGWSFFVENATFRRSDRSSCDERIIIHQAATTSLLRSEIDLTSNQTNGHDALRFEKSSKSSKKFLRVRDVLVKNSQTLRKISDGLVKVGQIPL